MADTNPVYEEENVSKQLYDQSCARARAQDPVLRSRMLQIMNDPTQQDAARLDSILALINDQQASVISPVVPGLPDRVAQPSGNPNIATASGALPVYQPLSIGDTPSNFEWSPSYQVSPPWFNQPLTSLPDSGFYSGSSGRTDGGGFSVDRLLDGHNDFQDPLGGDQIRAPGPTTGAQQTNIQENIDMDELLAEFEGGSASIPSVAQQQGSSATGTSGQTSGQ